MPDPLAATFDTRAELYERIRPGYPDALFEDLATTVGDTARVLEIGPGTGQATRGMLARGWSVVGLEPGPNLAAVARRVLVGDVEIVGSTFEDWRGDGPFDLVLAATSWHWVDPAVGYRRAASLLRPGGALALVATEHVLPAGGDPFFRDVQRLYDEVGLGDGSDGPEPPEAIAAPDVDAIRASDLFEEPTVHRYVRVIDYTADEYLALLDTYSNHIAASASQRERLFTGIRAMIAARPGGTVCKHYLTIAQVARAIPGARPR